MNKTLAIALIIASGFFACSNHSNFDALQGIWVGDSLSYYLRFEHDSVSYAHTSIDLMGKHDGKTIVYDLWDFLSPPTPLRPCRFVDDSLYVTGIDSHQICIGKLIRKGSKLSLYIRPYADPIQLSRLRPNPALTIRKIQISSSSPDRSQLLQDVEFSKAGLVFHGSSRSRYPGYFRSTLSSDIWPSLVDMASMLRYDQTGDLYRTRAAAYSDVREYGVAVFVNDSVRTFLFAQSEAPPEFIPLVSTMNSVTESASLQPIDTCFWFHSRLTLTYDLDDSLKYLEQFDSLHFRTARYPGGFRSLQRHLGHFLSVLPDSLFPYDFYVYLGDSGVIDSLCNYGIKAGYTVPSLKVAMLHSKPWIPALWQGKPVPIRKWICFHSPTEGLILN